MEAHERQDEIRAEQVRRVPLTPHQAERVVDELIESYGLDALPTVHIKVAVDGRWCVAWATHQAQCEPMPLVEWKRWLERHVGPTSPDMLKTTEG